MSINFSTLQGLTIPEGVVTQIADASGRVLWALNTGEPIVLEVAKITSDTYAGETTYTGEQFILLDIYPKTNGTVKVTYGGLTKTITDTSGAAEPNAQQVYFGTLYGVSDSVETPASGELTIEGDCYAFGCGAYTQSSKFSGIDCSCITSVSDWGAVVILVDRQFINCTGLRAIDLPDGVTNIGSYAFSGCTELTSVDIPSSVTNIGSYAFSGCTNLSLVSLPRGLATIEEKIFNNCLSITNITIPEGITSIGDSAFVGCEALTNVTIPEGVTNIGSYAFSGCEALTNVTIPASVTNIAEKGFYLNQGDGGRIVTMLSTTPPELGADFATNIFGMVDLYDAIIVPKGCASVYKAVDKWQHFVDKIMEAS